MRDSEISPMIFVSFLCYPLYQLQDILHLVYGHVFYDFLHFVQFMCSLCAM